MPTCPRPACMGATTNMASMQWHREAPLVSVDKQVTLHAGGCSARRDQLTTRAARPCPEQHRPDREPASRRPVCTAFWGRRGGDRERHGAAGGGGGLHQVALGAQRSALPPDSGDKIQKDGLSLGTWDSCVLQQCLLHLQAVLFRAQLPANTPAKAVLGPQGIFGSLLQPGPTLAAGK